MFLVALKTTRSPIRLLKSSAQVDSTHVIWMTDLAVGSKLGICITLMKNKTETLWVGDIITNLSFHPLSRLNTTRSPLKWFACQNI